MDQSEVQAILGLPDLERAHALKRLLGKLGRQSDVAEALGVNQGKISQYLSLLKLCDEACELMDPSLSEGERLYFGSACFLAQRDKELQRVAIKDLRKSASPKEQITQMRRKLRDHYDARHRNNLLAFARAPLFGEQAPPKPVRAPKEKKVRIPKEPKVKKVREPKPLVVKVKKEPKVRVKKEPKPKPQSKPKPAPVAKVVEPVAPRPLPPRLDLWRQTHAPRKPAVTKVAARPSYERAAPPQASSARLVKSDQASSFNLSDLLIQYWDDVDYFRYTSVKYDPVRYAELWRKKLLMFQRERTPRPDKYPDLDATDA